MSWPWKVKVIGQNKWHKLKGFYSSYLVLNLAAFHRLGTEIYPEMWFCKGHDLERSRSLGKINGTVSFLDLKNIDLDIKIFVPSALVQTLLSKTSFCIMVANVMRSCTSHVQTAQDVFSFIERPQPMLSCFKNLATFCPLITEIWPKTWFHKGHDLERSRS